MKQLTVASREEANYTKVNFPLGINNPILVRQTAPLLAYTKDGKYFIHFTREDLPDIVFDVNLIKSK